MGGVRSERSIGVGIVMGRRGAIEIARGNDMVGIGRAMVSEMSVVSNLGGEMVHESDEERLVPMITQSI